MGAIIAVIVIALVAALVVLTVPLVMLAQRREQRRLESLAAWAHSIGWTAYAGSVEVPWTARLPGANPRGVRCLFTGIYRDMPVSVAEYTYHTTQTTHVNGQTQVTTDSHDFVVCVVHLPYTYPGIEVSSRGSGSRMWRWLNGPDDTEIGIDQFDKDFHVRSTHPEMVRQIIGPALVRTHLAGLTPNWSLHGTDLLVYWQGRMEPARVLPALDSVVRIAGLLGH
ncbi:hypothetical protein [Actinopolymorpha alba]|uniref:hypothetical protein n=1 Tax=Actinopolymorpha alba TaxID=533267 RepID=UPI000378A0D7|nr:hypothetical protein [Actinopolymorpha alba]